MIIASATEYFFLSSEEMFSSYDPLLFLLLNDRYEDFIPYVTVIILPSLHSIFTYFHLDLICSLIVSSEFLPFVIVALTFKF